DVAIAIGGVACLYLVALFAGEVPDAYMTSALESGSLGVDTRFLLVAGVVLLVLYGFILLAMHDSTGRLRKGFLAAAIAFEVAFVTYWGIGAGSIVKDNDYAAYGEEVSQLIAAAEQRSPHCRMELIGSSNAIPPYAYGYQGATLFASSVPKSAYDTLAEYLPGNRRTLNRFEFTTPNPRQDSLLNIHYYISIDGPLDVPDTAEVARIGTCYLYESTYVGALGFMLPAGSAEVAYSPGVAELNIDEMLGNKLSGTVDAREPGTLFVSVPYSDGWRVQVDGSALDPAACQQIDGFVSFDLDAGSYRVDMVFVPTGFYPGLALSAIGLLLGAALAIRGNRIRVDRRALRP
ncbi:MAG: YfhO family protein, partial [Eggerthellaceae bacterium]|nr:YfhO family protein [Eggerthellaceae bacterium]